MNNFTKKIMSYYFRPFSDAATVCNSLRLYKTNFSNFLVYSRLSSSLSNNNNNTQVERSNFRDNKLRSIIEPTKYFTPLYSDMEDFENKFWEAYQKNLQEKRDMNDIYPDRIRYRKVYSDPFARAFGIIKDDILEFFGRLKRNPIVHIRDVTSSTTLPKEKQKFPSHVDVVIIGGGIVGTSVAFHLQERARDGLRVLVIEKDLSYSKASTVLSVGGIRQQFSTPENILLSKYGMDFLQQAESRLAIEGQPRPDFGLTFSGYLTLADENGFAQLLQNYELQKETGCFVEMYSKNQLKEKFPWINTEGVEAGVYGVQREGWFDPWSLLLAINRKTKELGTEYVVGTVTEASMRICGDYVVNEDGPTAMKQVQSLEVTLPDGETRTIKCAICVIAAGAWSKEVGYLFGIGKAPTGINSIPIPVEPRKRYVYCVKSPNGPGLKSPLLIDTNGAYFRREGLADLYLCGRAPKPEEEPPIDNLNVDYDFFEEKVWPSVANRCPSFENLKVFNAWAGYYDYNTFDQNAIIGMHPLFTNLYMATGFSGHGIQQAAGAGLALSELILDAELKTLNVQNFCYDRIATFDPIFEKCCY
ncbi:UNVERIFIED_CONTAM: hypothetical protein RMT77_007654 [Armadillidium vulgare]